MNALEEWVVAARHKSDLHRQPWWRRFLHKMSRCRACTYWKEYHK
jgi:hypothetical protein